MSPHLLSSAAIGVLHVLVVVAIAVRVILRRPARGVALAWLLLVAMLPFAGGLIYLLVGERRIGRRRAQGIDALRLDFRKIAAAAIPAGLTEVVWSRHSPAAQGMDRLGRKLVGSATVCGSRFQLFSDTQAMLKAIARDVDAAKTSVLMEFYIWNEGGTADEVLEALIRAAQRGVRCRILIDALGARPWWKSQQPQRLRDAGVELRAALPVGVLRTLVGRTDLRLHRKIVVVDGTVAWTGSMNLVDPCYFNAGAGVGEWVDAMVHRSTHPPLQKPAAHLAHASRTDSLSQRKRAGVRVKTCKVLRCADVTRRSRRSTSPHSSPAGRGDRDVRVRAKPS